MVDHARTNSRIGEAVNNDKAPGMTVVVIGVKGQRLIGRNIGNPDFIKLKRLARHMFECIDIDLVFKVADLRIGDLCAHLDQIGTTGQQRVIMHPDDARFELIGKIRFGIGLCQNVAA